MGATAARGLSSASGFAAASDARVAGMACSYRVGTIGRALER